MSDTSNPGRQHFLAILNPVSGRRDRLPEVHAVRRVLEDAGGTLDINITRGEGHGTQLARNLASDVDAVLVVGGDGTVCEVVNGLIDRPTPIVVLGSGTENLFARELAMPTRPAEIARTLLVGHPIAYDVGVINERHFLVVSGVGFDAECVLRLSRVRRGYITHWDYFWPIWRTFWHHRFPMLRIEADNECVFEDRGLALFGLTGRYAARLRILSRARYDDGLLDLCVLPCTSRGTLLKHTFRAFLRRNLERDGVVYRQCRQLRITSPEEVPVQIDGDVGGTLPVNCSIMPGAAHFLRVPLVRKA